MKRPHPMLRLSARLLLTLLLQLSTAWGAFALAYRLSWPPVPA